MTVKDENYYTVFGWMLNRLRLKGNDLKIYALIYSFSQDGESEYKGNIAYLKDFTGCSGATVRRSLEGLESAGYIEKTNHNTAEGKSNSYKAVPLDQVFAQLEGGAQNEQPPLLKMSSPPAQNEHPPVAQNEHPFLTDNNSKYIDSDNNKEIKESKKESRKEGSYKNSAGARESYDDIVAKYDLSDKVREGVGECIRHCSLNNHKFTNKALNDFLNALISYPEQQRLTAIQRFIGGKTYVLSPYTDKHYNFAGSFNNDIDYQHIMEVFLRDYLGEQADFVMRKLWEFIQHCAANGHKLTNSRFMGLCSKLKRLYLPRDAAKMVQSLDKAICGGYYDIKDVEGWGTKSVGFNTAAGINPLGDVDESDEEDDTG